MIPLFAVGFPLFFVTMWCSVCLLLSAVGGWRRIAERFPDIPIPDGATASYPMATGMVGLVSYRNCLKVQVAPGGVHVAVWKIFGLGHPPMFIPWNAMHNITLRKFLFIDQVAFDIGQPKLARMALPRKIFAHSPIPLSGGSAVPPLPAQ
jgi:hypothetical protein